ncbi:MAG: glycosyltransferase, partial [Candidatus Methanomethylicia archaeon]
MKTEFSFRSSDKQRICAVISTFNRKESLLKCLTALLEQRRPLDCIIIVDGPS